MFIPLDFVCLWFLAIIFVVSIVEIYILSLLIVLGLCYSSYTCGNCKSAEYEFPINRILCPYHSALLWNLDRSSDSYTFPM